MNEIRRNLEYMFLNCDFTDTYGDMEDTTPFEDTMDKIDYILNIIESANTHSLVDCNLAIKKLQRIIKEGESNEGGIS